MNTIDNKWIKDLKDRLEGYEKPVPEISWSVVSDRVSKRRKALIFWPSVAAVAVAAAIALLIVPWNGRGAIDVIEMPVAEVYEGTEAGGTEAVLADAVTSVALDVPEASSVTMEATATASVSKAESEVVREVEATSVALVDLEASETSAEVSEAKTDESLATADETDSAKVAAELSEAEDYAAAARYFAMLENQKQKNSKSGVSAKLYSSGSFGGKATNEGYRDPRLFSQQPMFSPAFNSPEMDYKETTKPSKEVKHLMPIKVGVSVRYNFTDKWSMETGVFWSNLISNCHESVGQLVYDYDQDLNFIGVPIKVNYNLYNKSGLSLYVSAGGAVEKMVKGYRQIVTQYNTPASSGARENHILEYSESRKVIQVDNLQKSFGLSLGADYVIGKHIGLYCEPGISYYPECQDLVSTYYNEKSLRFIVDFGIRINM